MHQLRRISVACIAILCLALAAGIVLWLVISLYFGVEVCDIEGRRATLPPKFAAFAGSIPVLCVTAATCAFEANSYFDGKKRIWWPSMRKGSPRPCVLKHLAVGAPMAALGLSVASVLMGCYKAKECADDSEQITTAFGVLLINLIPTLGMVVPAI
eukprot:TRINITY_DN972_c0_g1_i1.p1 TRINITY_DN972_c0_g1~~TRINITY_DN972_c0_g1_i1.p1  ORF type:complete len:156 (+),score=11.71 TRINITY_DN972_c0_g1_i1:841-1308(+)